jgi:protocatechuate 3,4-dioxygenase beta subunit
MADDDLAAGHSTDDAPGGVHTDGDGMTRRDFALRVASGVVAVALGGCGGSSAASDGGAGGTAARSTCTLYPQETEGPYFLDVDMLRRDITEGRRGTPLGLALQVVNAASCTPLAGVVVEVWHCDAAGVYSGYTGQLRGVDTRGQTFLRGSQVTDAEGRVRFDTIYPGWYPGRTTHVHFKVHVGSTREATSQIYFPEEVTAAVYATSEYVAHGQKDTSNANDGVARSGGLPPLATVATEATGHVATLTVAVAV